MKCFLGLKGEEARSEEPPPRCVSQPPTPQCMDPRILISYNVEYVPPIIYPLNSNPLLWQYLCTERAQDGGGQRCHRQGHLGFSHSLWPMSPANLLIPTEGGQEVQPHGSLFIVTYLVLPCNLTPKCAWQSLNDVPGFGTILAPLSVSCPGLVCSPGDVKGAHLVSTGSLIEQALGDASHAGWCFNSLVLRWIWGSLPMQLLPHPLSFLFAWVFFFGL